jgi:hypothetical protein
MLESSVKPAEKNSGGFFCSSDHQSSSGNKQQARGRHSSWQRKITSSAPRARSIRPLNEHRSTHLSCHMPSYCLSAVLQPSSCLGLQRPASRAPTTHVSTCGSYLALDAAHHGRIWPQAAPGRLFHRGAATDSETSFSDAWGASCRSTSAPNVVSGPLQTRLRTAVHLRAWLRPPASCARRQKHAQTFELLLKHEYTPRRHPCCCAAH